MNCQKSQHKPFSQVFQQDIAKSALDLNIPIFPMNLALKIPFKGLKWSHRCNWIHNIDELIAFYIKYPSPPWDPRKTEASEICRWAIMLDYLIVFDVDFLKDKDKNPIGDPQLGPVKQRWLDQASHNQKTQSTFQGKHTYHHIFRKSIKSNRLPNCRIPGTTIDILKNKKLMILYKKLPSIDVWKSLNFVPDDMLTCILNLNRKEQTAYHIEYNLSFPDHERNIRGNKEIHNALKYDDMIAFAKAIFKAKHSKEPYPLKELIDVVKSNINLHFTNYTLDELMPIIKEIYNEKR